MGQTQLGACLSVYDPNKNYGEITVPFKNTGGRIVSLIIALDYEYSPENVLTCSYDARNIFRVLERAEQSDCTIAMDYDMNQSYFPTKDAFKKLLKETSAKCQEGDWYVFFFAGHGENVPGPGGGTEAHGMDQAFVTPDGRGSLENEKTFLVDDDFAMTIDNAVPLGVKILCLIDCCHSGSICDIDTYKYKHEIYSISAAQDDQCAEDAGAGGTFTQSLMRSMRALSARYASEEYSIQELFDSVNNYAQAAITTDQNINFAWSGTDPHQVAWPLAASWSKYVEKAGLSAAQKITGADHVQHYGVKEDWLA